MKDREFMKLWTGETISQFGSQFSPIAISYAAYLFLNVDAFQFSLLAVFNSLSFLLFALPVGVFVDRRKRRRIMILSDLGRMATLGSIALAALLGVVSIIHFYIVTFVAGLFTVFFDIAYQSYLPSFVRRDQLVDANGKLETSSAVSQSVGPSIAGFVVTLVYAPFAVAGDALGYLGSAVFVSRIKRSEPEPVRSHRSSLEDIKEGLHLVIGSSTLRSIAACTATLNFFGGQQEQLWSSTYWGTFS